MVKSKWLRFFQQGSVPSVFDSAIVLAVNPMLFSLLKYLYYLAITCLLDSSSFVQADCWASFFVAGSPALTDGVLILAGLSQLSSGGCFHF